MESKTSALLQWLVNVYHIELAKNLLEIDKSDDFMPRSSWFERLTFRAAYRNSVAGGEAIH